MSAAIGIGPGRNIFRIGIQHPVENGYTRDPERNPNTGFDASPLRANGFTPKYP